MCRIFLSSISEVKILMEERIAMMLPQLNEKQKRLFLASEAIAYGRCGIAEVIRLSGFCSLFISLGYTVRILIASHV